MYRYQPYSTTSHGTVISYTPRTGIQVYTVLVQYKWTAVPVQIQVVQVTGTVQVQQALRPTVRGYLNSQGYQSSRRLVPVRTGTRTPY